MGGAVMRMILYFLVAVLALPVMANDFYDPMKPPSLALKKFRLEKAKSRPVSPQAVVKPKQQRWTLNSILISSQRQHAIINNKLVRKGDLIEGARLLSLKPDRVRLSSRGKVIELKLPGRGQSIKKPFKEKAL